MSLSGSVKIEQRFLFIYVRKFEPKAIYAPRNPH